MPTDAEISKIEIDFAKQYGLDLAGITKDEAALKALVANNPVDSSLIDGITYTYNGSLAFVPDLETLAFSEISPDARLSSRRVELNFDEALRYFQTCLQIRQQYDDVAKLRNDTRFKGEEFVRLDDVHTQEVEAGLYKLPWQEAADERAGLEQAVAQVSAQQSITQEMMSDGATGQKYSALLSDKSSEANAASNALIARNVANTEKDQVQNTALSTARYRNGIELASWLENLAGAKSNVAQLQSKLSIAQRKEQYLRKDEGFKTERADISRQLAWLQIAEHCRDGSELNYDQKLQNLKIIFNENLRNLIERSIVLADGIKENYMIDLPLGAPITGTILDEISLWLVRVQDALSKFKRTQRLTIFSKWNGDAIAVGSKNSAGLDVLSADITVNGDDLAGRTRLLRGITFEYIGTNSLPITLIVSPPKNAWVNSQSDPLVFGRICHASPNIELKPQHADAFWNGSAVGTWRITGMFDKTAGSIVKLIMHMWTVSG